MDAATTLSDLPTRVQLELLLAYRKCKEAGVGVLDSLQIKRTCIFTVDEAFYEYYNTKIERGLHQQSIQDVRDKTKRLRETCGDKKLSDVGLGDIKGILAPYKAVTFNTYLAGVSGFFEWCVKRQFIERNPCSAIDRAKIEPKPPAIFTVGQAQELLNVCKMIGSRDGAFLCHRIVRRD